MIDKSQLQRISGRLAVIQITAAAIIAGALVFTLVIFAMTDWQAVTGNIKMLTLLGAVTGFMAIGLAMIVPRLTTASPTQVAAQLLASQEQEPIDDNRIVDEWIGGLSTNRVTFSAIIEGAIFLNLVTFMLEQSVASLVVVAIGFALLILSFPFTGRLTDWLDQNVKLVKDEMRLMR